MSRELDCAVRTTVAALENLFQIATEEREEVTLWIEDNAGLNLQDAISLSHNSITVQGWVSSSYSC
ncbi:hypothetical protein WFK_00126 [Escherichia phage vB_EcoM_WFK]|nr:hypothetical protein WFL6982_00126 [Escherichia phage vB_EcoM_WFL6982]QBQ77151.1 hypothetical protein WFK_00126 [Escherichia phage vB_EcoM_WFK]